jgi:hypothetical protein
MEFPVMSRPWAKRARGSTGSVAPPQQPWCACSRPGPGCAAPRSQPPTPARCCSTGTYSNARPRDGLPRHASRVIAAGTARWSHPYRPCPRRARAQGIRESPAVNDGLLRSGAASSKGRSMSWPAGDRVVGAGNCRRPGSGCQSPDHVVQPQRRSLNAGSCWCRAVWLRASSSAGGAAGVM